MRNSLNALCLLLICALLAACGGGGGGGAAEAPAAVRVTITLSSTSVPANTGEFPPDPDSEFIVEVTVQVLNADGSPVNNGLPVTLRAQPNSLGQVSINDDPATTGVDEFAQLGNTATDDTIGGLVTFYFHSRTQTGTATVTATVTDPNTGQARSGSRNIQVVEGPPPLDQLSFSASSTQLPANILGVPVFIGSPYISEVGITALRRDGTAIIGEDLLSVAISPVSIAAFSTLDDPETTDVNEIEVLLGGGPVTTNGQGVGTVFVHSFDTAGIATLSVSFQDPDTGETISDTFDFEVVEQGATGVPNQISFNVPATPVYVQGTGGDDTTQFEISLTDGADEPVANPDNWNNVLVTVVREGPNSGETVTANNFAGVPQEGTNIRAATINGILSVVLLSGTDPGIVTVQVTADRADNNVNNGIQDPVSDLRDFVISDGRLFALEITGPNINAINVNAVSPDSEPDPMTGIPPDPDGTYSLTVSAVATDRFGQPVLQGTPIDFGVIGAPQVGFPSTGPGLFQLAGTDGNPNEGQVRFTAPGGAFQTAGGGAGPGDTLVLFTEDTPDQDLEGARTVASVTSQTRLDVTSRFNSNNTTGSSVDNGPIIDYAIGRAADANIGEQGFTNNVGAATVSLNYPVSQLGRSVIVWAQGNGEINDAGFVETVGDVELTRLPGVAPATFSALPEMIPGNRTVDVLLCLADALNSPIQGVSIGFSTADPLGATVTVDGQDFAGVVASPTGPDGCTIASVTSTGVSPGLDEDINLVFFVGSLSDTVAIVAPDGQTSTLFAIPSALNGNQNNREILLILLDAGGNPIQGVQIAGNCNGISGMSNAQFVTPPGVTDVNGETTAVIDAQVDFFGEAGDAVCDFFAAGGSPTARVNINGTDLCAFDPNFSPLCDDMGGGGPAVIRVNVEMQGTGSGTVTDNFSAISCSWDGATQTGQCFGDYLQSELATLLLTPTADMGSDFVSWGGACMGVGSATVGGSGANRTCNANFLLVP